MNFAFISRHEPTASQYDLADQQEITLVPIGDLDAFSVTVADVDEHGDFDGVVVVHPAAAMRLASQFLVGVFKNANRARPDEPPKFEAESLEIYDLRD
jgi:hypothetical protein